MVSWPLLPDEFTKQTLFTTVNEEKKLDKRINATELYRLNRVMLFKAFYLIDKLQRRF